MSKTVKKTLLTSDALTILNWVESRDSFWAKEKLPIKIQWDMRKNISELKKIRDAYNEFYQKIIDKYSKDEYSEDIENEDGTVTRNVKQEHMEEYTNEVREILTIENEVELKQFDIDDFGDLDILINETELLTFFIYDGDEEEK